LEELSRAPQKVIFFSHQWTSWHAPDPTTVQYRCMLAAMDSICTANGWKPEYVWVWCDYISIPQKTRCAQKIAINSLASYASCSNAFCIVAPTVEHADTGEECNVSSYNKRMWCRAENLCHSLRHGIDGMWVVTSEQDVSKLASNDAFMSSNLRVMQACTPR
jgi:hypothetical protein